MIQQKELGANSVSLHKEISFENEICQHLSQNGWLHAEDEILMIQERRIEGKR